MKIITILGGLGNQMFGYAYYKYLKDLYPNEKFYGFYPKAGLKLHNGLEIDKRFVVELPKSSLFSNFVAYPIFYFNKILLRLRLPLLLISTDEHQDSTKLLQNGYWQDKRYIPKGFKLEFNLANINEKNTRLVEEMRGCNSVSLHVRRGDYISNPKDLKTFGNICTTFYYQEAIRFIYKEVENPQFYIFSDDLEYAKRHYTGPNMHIVDWNKGTNSYYDMYLMSQAKYMILANSTFSFWAAILNVRKQMVLCPEKWNNTCNTPNIIMDDWIVIPSKK